MGGRARVEFVMQLNLQAGVRPDCVFLIMGLAKMPSADGDPERSNFPICARGKRYRRLELEQAA
jgi:hypothetical protein